MITLYFPTSNFMHVHFKLFIFLLFSKQKKKKCILISKTFEKWAAHFKQLAQFEMAFLSFRNNRKGVCTLLMVMLPLLAFSLSHPLNFSFLFFFFCTFNKNVTAFIFAAFTLCHKPQQNAYMCLFSQNVYKNTKEQTHTHSIKYALHIHSNASQEVVRLNGTIYIKVVFSSLLLLFFALSRMLVCVFAVFTMYYVYTICRFVLLAQANST